MQKFATDEPTCPEWLLPYGPRLPLAELVVEINQLFHAEEAADYDARHPELLEQGPPLWREMLAAAAPLLPTERLRALDFGCGTGFEAEQLLAWPGAAALQKLICYDLSPAMLAKCREKLRSAPAPVVFSSNWSEVTRDESDFDLLLTSSLLHHLPDALATLAEIEPLLRPGAVWLAGHEPSARFYRNARCVELLAGFDAERDTAPWTRAWDPRTWFARLGRRLRRRASPKQAAAKRALERGLFERQPPPRVVDRLVDFHVAHSPEEAHAGRGFDIEALEHRLRGRWRLVWFRSYSYLGPHYVGRQGPHWKDAAARLAREFPRDGANFSAVWQRTS